MAHLKYYFERNKNIYEKGLDYNKKLTSLVSFVSDWFFICDVTELTSPTRTCYKGINGYFAFLSLLYIATSIAQTHYFQEYSSYIDWLRYFIVLLITIVPLRKLMIKGFIYLFISNIILLNYAIPAVTNQLASYVILFIAFNLMGSLYNRAYLRKVMGYKGFELKRVEVTKLSYFYIYKRFIKKTTVQELETKELARLTQIDQ
ncbi:MAG: hypothetical protein GY793_09555 [Proteobacteria bacterium]|nr:hypothetical protein [Pseudomonadota bacterium]